MGLIMMQYYGLLIILSKFHFSFVAAPLVEKMFLSRPNLSPLKLPGKKNHGISLNHQFLASSMHHLRLLCTYIPSLTLIPLSNAWFVIDLLDGPYMFPN